MKVINRGSAFGMLNTIWFKQWHEKDETDRREQNADKEGNITKGRDNRRFR